MSLGANIFLKCFRGSGNVFASIFNHNQRLSSGDRHRQARGDPLRGIHPVLVSYRLPPIRAGAGVRHTHHFRFVRHNSRNKGIRCCRPSTRLSRSCRRRTEVAPDADMRTDMRSRTPCRAQPPHTPSSSPAVFGLSCSYISITQGAFLPSVWMKLASPIFQ